MDHLTLIIIALIFMGFGLLSGKIEGSLLTPPLLFSGLGLLFSQNNLALVDLHIDPEAIYTITLLTISLSIIAHGISAVPFARFYGKKIAAMGKCAKIVPVQEIPTKTGKRLNKLTKKH
ncbi:MAG: hypothetical protein IBX55_18135 [Methyloprofundus sp.]|nr:hypothetical protein [Methyloprofundus sp.]